MTLIIVIIAAVFGYWVVSFLIDQLHANQANQAPLRAGNATPDRLTWACQTLRVNLPIDIGGLQDAYRERMADYTSTKLANLGGELREMAERRAGEIADAYRIVAEHLQFPAVPPSIW